MDRHDASDGVRILPAEPVEVGTLHLEVAAEQFGFAGQHNLLPLGDPEIRVEPDRLERAGAVADDRFDHRAAPRDPSV